MVSTMPTGPAAGWPPPPSARNLGPPRAGRRPHPHGTWARRGPAAGPIRTEPGPAAGRPPAPSAWTRPGRHRPNGMFRSGRVSVWRNRARSRRRRISRCSTRRAQNRALLARQLLLERSAAHTAESAIEHLVGLQAQTPRDPYFGLWSRLDGFDPDALGALLTNRAGRPDDADAGDRPPRERPPTRPDCARSSSPQLNVHSRGRGANGSRVLTSMRSRPPPATCSPTRLSP